VAEWWQRQRLPLLWWLLAVGLAVGLKWHFSTAAASELGWMLRPLAWLLRAATGWRFERNADGEWQSLDAGIVLMKACAGINFMVLTFASWCWLWRPASAASPTAPLRLHRYSLRLGRALLCAWVTALAVNALRILVIAHTQSRLERWLQPQDAHRLLGLLIYLPALTVQWLWADRGHAPRALLMGCGLYAALMLAAPLLTGHAWADPGTYSVHAAFVLAAALPLCGIAYWLHRAGRPGAQRVTGEVHPPTIGPGDSRHGVIHDAKRASSPTPACVPAGIGRDAGGHGALGRWRTTGIHGYECRPRRDQQRAPAAAHSCALFRHL
jgi:exosortase K